jgi:uncharacterized membrane protein YgaE (UPF0421/DUF939 family)
MSSNGQDEQFLARWLHVDADVFSGERSRELLEAAAARSRASSRSALARLRPNLWSLVQTAVAAALAWLIARHALDHPSPFFAPVSAIMALGVTRGQRVRRAVELIVGVALGIGLGALLIEAIGIGVAQLVLAVTLAMGAAIMLGAGSMLLTEAGVSAALVATVAPTTHGFPPTRLLDALVGGAIALVFSQLLFPVHPVRVVREAAEAMVGELSETLSDVAAALDTRDLPAAEEAMVRARRINADWSRFEQALDVGGEAARYAPRRRRLRERYRMYREVGVPLGLLVRDVHVLARGAVRALMIEDPLPDGLREALCDLARAMRELPACLGAEPEEARVRSLAVEATTASTALAPANENLSLSVLVAYTQATAADLLRALGMKRESAHEEIGEAALSVRP